MDFAEKRSDPNTPSALIMAHPGHELLVHHWIERARPIAFVLTDGSGGSDIGRLSYSRALMESLGARCGSVFGAASDQEWYRAILAHDAAPFHAAVSAIANSCQMEGVARIVCDPVELFNPMHDLANAIAHAVALRLRPDVEISTFPIENAAAPERATRILLDGIAAARKRAAVAAYAPLSHERAKYEDLIEQRYEAFADDMPGFSWPDQLREEPFYESFGRRRIQENRYYKLITYADHVRPLALQTRELKAAA